MPLLYSAAHQGPEGMILCKAAAEQYVLWKAMYK